jgi:uncharacterized protein HemX
MKRMMTILLALSIGTFFVSAQQQDNTPRVDKREAHQQARINHGVKSGQLTPKEANRLEKQQSKIKSDEAKAKADGKVTPKERAKLTREQNRASRNIYRKKHNAKTIDSK